MRPVGRTTVRAPTPDGVRPPRTRDEHSRSTDPPHAGTSSVDGGATTAVPTLSPLVSGLEHGSTIQQDAEGARYVSVSAPPASGTPAQPAGSFHAPARRRPSASETSRVALRQMTRSPDAPHPPAPLPGYPQGGGPGVRGSVAAAAMRWPTHPEENRP